MGTCTPCPLQEYTNAIFKRKTLEIRILETDGLYGCDVFDTEGKPLAGVMPEYKSQVEAVAAAFRYTWGRTIYRYRSTAKTKVGGSNRCTGFEVWFEFQESWRCLS